MGVKMKKVFKNQTLSFGLGSGFSSGINLNLTQ
jgi:hypothetical protein